MGGLVTIMYSKKIYLKEDDIKKTTTDNSLVSKEVVDQLRGLYGVMEYNAATELVFGDPYIIVTKLTVFQAKMLVTHAKLLNTVIKEKRGKDITPKKNIKQYRDIWNTLEKRAR